MLREYRILGIYVARQMSQVVKSHDVSTGTRTQGLKLYRASALPTELLRPYIVTTFTHLDTR